MDRIVYDAYEELKKYANCAGKYVSTSEMNEILKHLKKKEFFNDTMLRVVMVGRTNAGKSKLTNALIGKKIAPVKGRELTAWNTNFWPSGSEYCITTNSADESEEMSVDQYIDIMSTKEKRTEFLKDKKNIDLFFKADDIHFAILDIPGFITQNKQNEILAYEAVREADLVLLVIPGDVSLSGDDIALFEELKKNKKPTEIIISKSDCRSIEELQEMKKEIQKTFSVDGEIFDISSNDCMKGKEEALQKRKRIIERINQYQVLEEEARKRNNATFESECVKMLKSLQEKVLHDVDKKFSKKYEEQAGLYNKAEQLTQAVREELKGSMEELYCAQYKDLIIRRMTSMPISECNPQAIINECIPEDYMLEFWKNEVDKIVALSEKIWEKEIGETKELSQYAEVLKKGRERSNHMKMGLFDQERILGGVRTAAGLGTAISFYQAVLGPAAPYITMASAMTSVGLPLAALGAGLSVIFGFIAKSGKDTISKAEAEQILSDELRKNANEIVFYIIDIIEKSNKDYITKAITLQEEKLLHSLPTDRNEIDTVIDSLENTGTILFNRELELTEKINFYINTPIQELSRIEYVDPVEQVIHDFISRIDKLHGQCVIDTSNSIPFMPVLYLSDANKEHLFSVIEEMCTRNVPFEREIKNTQFENSFVYEDEICAIYYRHETNMKKIEVEYIDIFEHDEMNIEKYGKKIREGSVLSDCQMRRMIISDICHARNRVEILVPWMNEAMYSKSDYYKSNMFDAIGQALKNGATIIIGCGNSEDHNKENEEKSKEMKGKLEEAYQSYLENNQLIFHMNSFTHEKFLVIDDRKAMCGSYNFLSNNGRFEDKSSVVMRIPKRKNTYGMNGGSSESEHPGESMKITENIEGVQIVLSRMRRKYS